MGVSHRFRGIGFDCCYLDPADEDTGDTRGVPDLPRGLSAAITSTGPTLDYPWPRIRDGKPSARSQHPTPFRFFERIANRVSV